MACQYVIISKIKEKILLRPGFEPGYPVCILVYYQLYYQDKLTYHVII